MRRGYSLRIKAVEHMRCGLCMRVLLCGTARWSGTVRQAGESSGPRAVTADRLRTVRRIAISGVATGLGALHESRWDH